MNDLTSKLPSPRSLTWYAASLASCAVLLAACGSSSDPGSTSSAGATNAGASAGNKAGAGSTPGGALSAGAGGLGTVGIAQGGANAAGTSAQGGASTAGGAAQGGGSAGGASGAGTQGGAAGAAGAPATNTVAIASHPVAVTMGKVFNVAEDFFDDGFLPPSPLANFGFHTPIIPIVRADGSIDVAWLDYTNGKGRPMELPSLGMVYVTHIDPALGAGSTVATGIQSYRLLGFAADPSGNFYIAYNADHPFKNATQGNPNNTNGNELRIAKSNGSDFGTKAWDSLIFGDKDNTKDLSKGNAGAAGSGVLAFDTTNQKLVLYVAHQMAWGDNGTRHQAGFFGLIDPATGKQVPPGGGATQNTGAGWFYSHNFDQRLLVVSGVSYTLSHGDAFSRQLGIAAWTLDSYSKKNDTTFNQSYFTIMGNEGDNKTDTETGQFIRLSDGRFVLVHTTSQGRAARDVRIVLANGTTGATTSSAWLTTNTGDLQATMPKVEQLGDKLLVTYGTWDSTDRTKKTINWSSVLLDLTLKPTTATKPIPSVEFVAGSPLFRFTGGANAGSVGWVSGNAAHTLTVNVASSAP